MAHLLVVLLKILHEQLARLLVQRRLWEWVDQQAAHNLQHVAYAEVTLPVLFEGVDANLTRFGYVRVEDSRDKEAWARPQRNVGGCAASL